MKKLFYFVLFIVVLRSTDCEDALRLLVIAEKRQESLLSLLSESLKKSSKWQDIPVAVDREQTPEDAEAQLCQAVSSGGSALLDLTWGGWEKAHEVSTSAGIPYLRAELSVAPFMAATESLIDARKGTDAAFIFGGPEELDQGLYYLISQSSLRVVVADRLENGADERLAKMRPSPSFFVILTAGRDMDVLYKQSVSANLVFPFSRWILTFTDFSDSAFNVDNIQASQSVTALLTPSKTLCCDLQRLPEGCACPEDSQVPVLTVSAVAALLDELAVSVGAALAEGRKWDCADGGIKGGDNATVDAVRSALLKMMDGHPGLTWDAKSSLLAPSVRVQIQIVNATKESTMAQVSDLAEWTATRGFQVLPDREIPPMKRFFRVGTVEAMPWAFPLTDDNGRPVKDAEGKQVWTGYCIDFIHRLSELMDFDYELVLPQDGSYGHRDRETGEWVGAVGELARGETEILVSALTMTSEREEVIDFVPPYFEQSGISIVIRKPVRKTSLFKFMTVLRLEVWLSIVGALTVTGLMIWVLDKYSPYSARNNKELYPYPCREFTLKESFWFALTSFTPQGGGEAPKALSGRTLVAAYWLFVVLMLATFTANLAAFLTVERMQSPVQSLEQLARQSRINYTVVNNSETHAYFKNMKHAEDTLYRVWKEITLNASSDQSQYRVWDYPIKEQYGHILLAIEKAGTVPDASVGFQKVIESEKAEFAFIHNAAHLRYEISRNCNLTEVGELFAEQPYAVAVQQGSYLQEEISRRILDLQKDRYFETLTGKYWNSSALSSCPNADDNEGITLESLGGVFIATLFGLAFAMLTLAVEVFYHRRKQRQKKGAGTLLNVRPANENSDNRGPGSGGINPGSGVNNVLAKSVLLTPNLAFASNMPNPQEQPVKQSSRRRSRGRAGPVAPELIGAPSNVSYISVYPKDFY